MRSRTAGDTTSGLRRARDTVIALTPAAAAISSSVTLPPLRFLIEVPHLTSKNILQKVS
jgi:hypothetical protein